MISGFVVAGTQSGCGKTSVSLALMAALARRGLQVAPFKVGPDFIDPGHHRIVTGRASYNLDGWMLPREYNAALFDRKTAGCDIAIVEGVMGLFDGYDGKTEAGSTAQMAKWLGLPVILVVDARSMARSAAALVQGFERFDPDLSFAGVVFNRIGSARHFSYLMEALAGAVDMPCLGGLSRDDGLTMPERHLGLVTVEDRGWTDEAVGRLAHWVESGIDLARLAPATEKGGRPPAAGIATPPPGADRVRIGVARDRAFCFYYPDNLELMAACGAELVEFSPIEAPALPEGLDGLYLGGGYPELAAEELSANTAVRRGVAEASRRGLPIYGECGGFMYLCRELIDPEGAAHPMTGCFPFTVEMNRRLRSLGYREVTLTAPTILGDPGGVIRGHEFHYSSLSADPSPGKVPTVFAVSARGGGRSESAGYLLRQTLGSYLHLHFGSNPAAAERFVAACRFTRNRKEPRP